MSSYAWGMLCIMFMAAIGWIANLVQVMGMLSEPLTALIVLKLAGILIAPAGVVLGWLGILF